MFLDHTQRRSTVGSTPLSSPIRATCPAHLIRLDFTTRTILGKEYRSFSSSSCSFLHSPVTSSLLGPNTFLNTLFSNTLSLRCSLNVSDQVSHPYKTTGKIIVLVMLWPNLPTVTSDAFCHCMKYSFLCIHRNILYLLYCRPLSALVAVLAYCSILF